MPSGAGPAVALPCRMVRGVEGVGTRLLGEFNREAWRIDTRSHNERYKKSGASLSGIQGPVSPSSALGRCCSPPAVAMAIARLTHLKISIPSSGAPPGQVPAECFSGGTPHVPPSLRRRVSFTDEATMLGEEDSPECSPVLPLLILPVVVEEVVDVRESEALPSLILPVVEEFNSGAPVATRVDLVPIATGSGFPPPPGFSPFVWPVDDGGMDVDDLCVQIGGDCLLTFSLIGRVSSDVSHAAGSSEEGVLISPSVDNSLVPDLVWVPALPQSTGPYVDRKCPVPRWRLAREGPFLEERSPESIRSLKPGYAFKNTTNRASDYAAPVGDYGFPLHHPRFVEWIGVPQSAGLVEFSGSQWSTNFCNTRLLWQPFICSAMWV